MSGELTPHNSNAAVPTDGDNRYTSVQHKLKTLGKAMDSGMVELDALIRDMKSDGAESESLARDIAHAGLAKKFIEMQNAVSVANGGAAIEVRKLNETAQEVVDLTSETRTIHFRLYEGLDVIRTGRSEATPRPGFFERKGG